MCAQAYLVPNVITMELLNFRIEALGKLGVEIYLSEFQFPGERPERSVNICAPCCEELTMEN